MVRYRSGIFRHVLKFVLLSAAASAAPPGEARAGGEHELARGPVTRELVVRTAIAKSPALRAASSRKQALLAESRAEGQLPAPELMLDVWQVPLSDPARVDRAGMIMLGLRQDIPPPGSLGARADARTQAASGASAEARVQAHALARATGHAYVDYAAATFLHRLHADHVGLLERSEAAARARVAGGASLTDELMVQAENARLRVELASERTNIEASKIRLNALMARRATADIGPPVWGGMPALQQNVSALIARAERERPELRLRAAELGARRAEERAAKREALWPAFSVSALYFAPTDVMPEHGYGFATTMSLPWLWGPGRGSRDARKWEASAVSEEIAQARLGIEQDVAAALAQLQSSAERVRLLETQARPATLRLQQTARSGYIGGSASMQTLLAADRALLELEIQLIMMRAELEHAVVDLEWATGAATELTERRP
jgi:outer membrane protein, heavy metal efflux system